QYWNSTLKKKRIFNSSVWGSVEIEKNIHSVTNANYVGLTTDGYKTIYFSTGGSNRTYTTPAVAQSVGRRIKLVKTDTGTGNVTITASDGSLIDPDNASDLFAQGATTEIECDGSNWYV